MNDPDAAYLLRGAAIVSCSTRVGDRVGDVLVAGGAIEAIGDELAVADDRKVVELDLRGCVLLPGLQDTHRHAWQGQLRRLIPDAVFDTYKNMVLRVGPAYRPEDVYAGTLITALSSLDGGTTTVLDFAHNTRSPDHAAASIRAWDESGGRAVIAFCPPAFGECTGDWPEIVEVAAAQVADHPRISVRMGLLANEVPGLDPRMFLTAEKLRDAAAIGVGVSIDGAFGDGASADVVQLASAGLLGPHVTFIHCGDLTPEAWHAIADSGATISLAVTSDAFLGAASSEAPIQLAIDHGVATSLGVDVECCLSGDLFSQMRATLTLQRMGQHRAAWQESREPQLLTARDVLGYATVNGAHANGIGGSVGSIEPGKKADLVAVRMDGLNAIPANNAIGTAVLTGEAGSVHTVFVEGRPVKVDGRMAGVDVVAVRELVERSRDYLLDRAGVTFDPLGDGPSELDG